MHSKWYRKRTDPEAAYIAAQCGVSDLFGVLSEVIHADDLKQVQMAMGVRLETMRLLFTPTLDPQGAGDGECD